MKNNGGIVKVNEQHLIGEEGSHCVSFIEPFIEHTTDAGMLTPQPLFIVVEATEEEIAAVAEMLRKQCYKERE